MITQQPFLDEHRVILSNICEDIKLSPSFLYITNILKCHTDKIQKDQISNCILNFTDELATLDPCAIIVCGKEPQKYVEKYRPGLKHIKMSSLSVLLKGKSGINKMKQCLKIVKDLYIGE